MTVVFVAVLVLATGTAAYWLLSRPRPRRASAPAKAGGRFGGVEIRARRGSCGAAHALVGRRFLSKDAPALPLAACTARQCTCTFSKLKDRRTDARRFEHGGLGASLFLAANRRMKRERRRTAAAVRKL